MVCLSASTVIAGCGGAKTFPAAADTPEVKAQIEANDKKVDEQEKGR